MPLNQYNCKGKWLYTGSKSSDPLDIHTQQSILRKYYRVTVIKQHSVMK